MVDDARRHIHRWFLSIKLVENKYSPHSEFSLGYNAQNIGWASFQLHNLMTRRKWHGLGQKENDFGWFCNSIRDIKWWIKLMKGKRKGKDKQPRRFKSEKSKSHINKMDWPKLWMNWIWIGWIHFRELDSMWFFPEGRHCLWEESIPKWTIPFPDYRSICIQMMIILLSFCPIDQISIYNSQNW